MTCFFEQNIGFVLFLHAFLREERMVYLSFLSPVQQHPVPKAGKARLGGVPLRGLPPRLGAAAFFRWDIARRWGWIG